jgi:hypothetical protein
MSLTVRYEYCGKYRDCIIEYSDGDDIECLFDIHFTDIIDNYIYNIDEPISVLNFVKLRVPNRYEELKNHLKKEILAVLDKVDM